MKPNEIFIAQPENSDQVEALKTFLKALKIKFKVTTNEVKKYNPDFVNKILESKSQVLEGKITRIKKESLKDILGL
jgi:hypothetical protein